MYPFIATAIRGVRPKRIPERSTANDFTELLSKIKKNIFQGDNIRKGSRESMSVPNSSIFPGIGTRNPVRNAVTKKAVREITYRGMFRSGMYERYRKFP